MKNIIYLQSGGGLDHYSSVVSPYATLYGSKASSRDDDDDTTSSKKSKKSDDGLISDSLLLELAKKAIPVDFDRIMGKLYAFQNNSNFGIGVSSKKMYTLLSDINRATVAYNYLDKARTVAEKNEALDEVAVDSRGFLYVPSEDGTINKVHMSKFDYEKLMALTVGELFELRLYNPSLAEDQTIATTVGNSIGMEKINDFIKQVIDAVGSADDKLEAFVTLGLIAGDKAKRPSDRQKQALEQLNNSLQKGDNIWVKISQSSNDKNLDSALSYILSMMPNNMRNLLVAHNVTNGLSYKDSIHNIHTGETIENAFLMKRNNSNTVAVDSTLNKLMGTDTADLRRLTTAEVFFNQNLHYGPIVITDPDDGSENKYALFTEGSIFLSLVLDSGESAGQGALSDVLYRNGKGMGKYLDMSKTYLGTQKMNPEILGRILYKSDRAGNIWMPTDSNGNINWELFNALSEAEKEIKNKGYTSIADKNACHQAYGSPLRYTPEELVKSVIDDVNINLFLQTFAYAHEDLVDDTTMYTKLPKDRIKMLNEEIRRINKEQHTNIDIDRGIKNDYVKIPVFIKINPNAGIDAAYYARQGSKVPDRTLTEDLVYEMINLQPTMLIGTDVSIFEQ